LDGLEDLWEDFILEVLGVLDEDGVVDLKEKLYEISSPDVEHSAVEDISNRALRIVCNCLSDSGLLVTSAKKPPLSSHKRYKIPMFYQLLRYVLMPSRDTGEGSEVLALELLNLAGRDFGVDCHRERLSHIIRTVAEHLTHMSEAVLTVVRALGDFFVLREVTRPRLRRLRHFRNGGVKIARLAGIEVSPVVEKVPDDGAYGSAFSLFEINVSKFVTWISHKYSPELILHIL
jgi:hypothetical protein